jgi:HlyD family secretion protein
MYNVEREERNEGLGFILSFPQRRGSQTRIQRGFYRAHYIVAVKAPGLWRTDGVLSTILLMFVLQPSLIHFSIPMNNLRIAAVVFALLAGCSKASHDFYPGYAEADYVRLSSPIAGAVGKLYLQKGDHAALNAPAFALEQQNERAAREEALSRVARAQAVLDDLQKGKRPQEIAAVRAQLAQAQAALKFSGDELARAEKLLRNKFISSSQADQARTAAARDRAQVKELAAQLRVAQLPARSDQIDAAQQDLRAAQAQLEQANWKLDQKTQRTPAAGEVVDVLYREGEWVAAGNPVITLLPPQNIKARFFVPEKTLGVLRLGQSVSLQCDGCGTPIPATISFIAREAEYTSPLIYSKENRASLVFMIEARPAPEQAQRLHPGQPLEIRIAGSTGSAP